MPFVTVSRLSVQGSAAVTWPASKTESPNTIKRGFTARSYRAPILPASRQTAGAVTLLEEPELQIHVGFVNRGEQSWQGWSKPHLTTRKNSSEAPSDEISGGDDAIIVIWNRRPKKESIGPHSPDLGSNTSRFRQRRLNRRRTESIGRAANAQNRYRIHDDRHDRPGISAHRNSTDFQHDVESLHDLPKHRVFVVEVRSGSQCHKELAAIGIGPRVRHRENASLIVVERWMELIFETI